MLEPDLARDHGFDLLERNRRHLVDELPQLVDVDVWQQVAARRQQLPQLHVRRPEILERLAEPDGAFARRGPVADDADFAQDTQEVRAPATRVNSSGRPTRLPFGGNEPFVPAASRRKTGRALRWRAVRRAVLLALAALAAGCGEASDRDPAHAERRESRFAGAELTVPKRAPDLALRDQDGALVRLSAQRGRYVIVTFLYTHCPDVCPLIATNLNTALRSLGARREGVRVLAVSVDPKGDTPSAVRAYARKLRLLPQFRYLIGTKSELTPVWRDYAVLAVAADPELVDHVASTALVDREGRRRVLYGAHVKAADVLHDLRMLMSGESAR